MQGFADDGTTLTVGKVVYTLCEIMQKLLYGVENGVQTDSCLLITVKQR